MPSPQSVAIRALPLLLVAAVLAACGGGASGGGSQPRSVDETATTAATTGTTSAAPSSGAAAAVPLGDVKAEPATRSGGARLRAQDVERIVAELWVARQHAIDLNDEGGFDVVEWGSPLAHDVSATRYVACGCEPKRVHRDVQRVVALPPTGAHPSVVLAEVFTLAPETGERGRYVVAARRFGASWKLAFVTWDEDDPLGRQRLTATKRHAPPTTAADRRRGVAQFLRLQRESQRWVATGRPISTAFVSGIEIAKRQRPGRAGGDRTETDYGATVRTAMLVRPADGVYVFRLDRRRLVACGTLHTLIRFELAGGRLSQDADRRGFGPLLAPGAYSAIVDDTQSMTCVLDRGASQARRYDVVGNYFGLVAVDGSR